MEEQKPLDPEQGKTPVPEHEIPDGEPSIGDHYTRLAMILLSLTCSVSVIVFAVRHFAGY